MADDFAWPKRGDKAFAPAADGACFHMPSILILDSPCANAFLIAAKIVVDKCEADGDCPSNDTLFFPLAYLYRHCLELRLKAIVHVGVGMRFFAKADVEESISQHNLMRLWNHAKKLLRHRWPGEDETPLKTTEAVIQEFHRSDPNGQMFRYDADKEGRPHQRETLPERISPAQLRKSVEGVCSFLDATCGELERNLSSLLEYERECE